MKKAVFLSIGIVSLSGCAFNDPPCEEILEVQRQERMCADLKKQMNNKSNPQIALTARERYQEACVDLRYYRNEYDTICKGDEKPIGEQ
ncbi:MAG: hypothetical protein ACFHVJ_15335 [Aestuariibacter sp.]